MEKLQSLLKKLLNLWYYYLYKQLAVSTDYPFNHFFVRKTTYLRIEIKTFKKRQRFLKFKNKLQIFFLECC